MGAVYITTFNGCSPRIAGSHAHYFRRYMVIAVYHSSMDSTVIGIFILGLGVLADSVTSALEAASVTDDRTISMPTITGKGKPSYAPRSPSGSLMRSNRANGPGSPGTTS